MSHYKILGVDKKASIDEIKKSYRKLAMQYHPDKAPKEKKESYEQKFKGISEAYDILSDNDKRQRYDMEQNGISFRNNGMNTPDIFRAFMHSGRPPPHVFFFNQQKAPQTCSVTQHVQTLPNGKRKITKIITRLHNGIKIQEYEETIV
jgi:DnaJ-class molecular chaperone